MSPHAARELDAALGEVDRLAHTVEELLALSGAGERQVSGTSVDLDAVARSALHRWQPTANARGIALKHPRGDVPAIGWAVWPDVERALDCLLENAINYSPPGSQVEVVSGRSRIEVSDRGPGLARDEHDAVFERSHRGRAGRSGPPGSGLGLAIARELTRTWSGEVTIKEREGGGSVAVLSLPTHAESQDQPPSLRALNPTPSTFSS